MPATRPLVTFCLFAALLAPVGAAEPPGDQPIAPTDKTIELFNGRDLAGLYTFLKGRGVRREADEVFRVEDGSIRVSGEGQGYIATEHAYRDYHLSVEYKWGSADDGSGYVRNAGVLVHGTGPDGGHASGVWMASLEVQLAQGCEGDLIVIRGKDDRGQAIPVDMASEVRIAEDRKTRWQAGGEKVRYSGKQFWWSRARAVLRGEAGYPRHGGCGQPAGRVDPRRRAFAEAIA